MNGPDWDTRYSKHYVRRDGWLPASKEYIKKTGKSVVKYFTLCDVHAIDIFMLEMEGILPRDENGKLPNVIICEGSVHKVPLINKLVKPPLEEAIILANLEDLITFEDDEYTRTTPLKTYERDRSKRQRLRLKERHERFKLFLPFDIINFDPSNSILGQALEVNKLYKALEKIFELQKLTNYFLLFVTTNISNPHVSIVRKCMKELGENLEKYPRLKEAMTKRLGEVEYNKIPEQYRIPICFVKSFVVDIARRKGWYCEHRGVFVYENPDKSKMLASVVFCTQVRGEQDEAAYLNDIISVIGGQMKYHSYADSLKDKPIQEDLKAIISYREKVRRG
ncbi:MAG TPA: hypothetical protein G4N91_02480 [Dehalococcoidia bacterium]|nr:hypothetical protein [Dehalococcoidia bacterium]